MKSPCPHTLTTLLTNAVMREFIRVEAEVLPGDTITTAQVTHRIYDIIAAVLAKHPPPPP